MGFITVPSQETAKSLARLLVKQHLVACVNIHNRPVTSIYWWEGKIEEEVEGEFLLMFKTKTTLVEECIEVVKEHHPYDTPEVIITSIEQGNEDYLNWIDQVTK